MGIMDKILFWRKKDDLGLRNELGMGNLGEEIGRMPSDDLGLPGYEQPQQQFRTQPQMESIESSRAYTASKDMEVVSAKLDAIKAAIESINQRLANLERMAGAEEEPDRKRGWY